MWPNVNYPLLFFNNELWFNIAKVAAEKTDRKKTKQNKHKN